MVSFNVTRRRMLAGAAVVVAGLWCASWAAAAGPSDLATAEKAVTKSQGEEGAANTEWNSREMARSATREIARSERQKTQVALDEAVAAKAAAQSAPSDATRQAAEQKLATLREATTRLIADTIAANKASNELFVAENLLRDKMAATRTAELAVLEAKACAAEQAKAPEAAAARQAVREAAVLAPWEIQQWAGVQRGTGYELSEQSGEAARIATAIAAFEVDPAQKATVAKFAADQSAQKAASDKLIGEMTAAMDAAEAQIYPLRVAAMGGLMPLAADRWDYAKARHLLVRAGFGGTPQEIQQLHAMGLHKAVDHLLEFHRQPYAAAPFDATPPRPGDPLEGRLRNDFVRGQVFGAHNGVERGQVGALRQWWLRRMVESPRPLQEKLTLLWHGHFATQDSVVQNSYILYRQNMLFREHAAGNFGALLYGLVHDPAMLRYLDNNRNVKGQPNENLAREIMELFAMGVDQGYKEKDIVEGARALTGYTFDNHLGVFRYDHSQHDQGDKTIFGQTGPWSGDDFVRLILDQPATPRFISLKLCEYFAYRDPKPETIDRLAAVLKYHHYELTPLLRNLFLSEEFYSDAAINSQIKSPVQLVVSALHDLGVRQLTRYDGLDSVVREMGQDLFEPPDVKGWRYGRTWISTGRIFTRYNTVAELVNTAPQPGGNGVDLVAVLQAAGCKSPAEVVDYLAKACLAKPLPDQKRQELAAALAKLPPCGEWAARRQEANEALRQALILLLSTPEYQFT